MRTRLPARSAVICASFALAAIGLAAQAASPALSPTVPLTRRGHSTRRARRNRGTLRPDDGYPRRLPRPDAAHRRQPARPGRENPHDADLLPRQRWQRFGSEIRQEPRHCDEHGRKERPDRLRDPRSLSPWIAFRTDVAVIVCMTSCYFRGGWEGRSSMRLASEPRG